MILRGKGASKGLAIGKVYFADHGAANTEPRFTTDTGYELERFFKAKDVAVQQLGEIMASATAALGTENAHLFEIHQMMLDDEDFLDSIRKLIEDKHYCAESAVWETTQRFSGDFSEMDDTYMQARAADVLDIGQRVINILLGRSTDLTATSEPLIMAAKEFVPSETAQMSREKTLALITVGGSTNSHTAIFARTMGIPAVIGLGEGLSPEADGQLCIVDGDTGEVIFNPTPDVLTAARRRQKEQAALRAELNQYRDRPTQTKSGKPIQLYANIGSVQDAKIAVENGAQGIGLFRSEFLYLERTDYPDEQTQFEAYRTVLEIMGKKQVIIRTLDIGADKQVGYFALPPEENPALGMRALRICLMWPEIFKTQLRAIYRASIYGNAAIMLPMVTSLWEVRRAKEIAEEVRAALTRENITFKADIPIGIMIETPAAAIISDLLAPEVDFFSIGTNDLIQYTLSVDRENDMLETFYAPHHDAVLRLIRHTAASAHAANIWCGICGDLGADLTLTQSFIEMGIDELSVAASSILPLRKLICELE